MITLIEAKQFRCLQYVRQELGPFHVLVGPNASGKTTFLDVVAFLGSLVTNGLDGALGERTQNFSDLLWQRTGSKFELAIEAAIPENRKKNLRNKAFDIVRYEVCLGIDEETSETAILTEKVLLKTKSKNECQPSPKTLFPTLSSHFPPSTILSPVMDMETETVVYKGLNGIDNFHSEVFSEEYIDWALAFKLGPRKSALGNLPEDESKFPVASWLKQLLTDGVQQYVLNSLLIRKASPPGQTRGLKPDGSNLPWVVDALQRNNPANFSSWIEHLKTALPELENIRTIERPDDRHRYLMLCYRGGLEVPSWMASDGTLRLLALTLPAYLPDFTGVYLIEEPENGIHPRAVETMFQSLSSVYDAQILLASHSPVILGMVDVKDVLCFAKTPDGATDIVLGRQHPALRDWQGTTSLGTLFAGGVLG